MSVCCLDQMYRGGQKLLDRHRYQFPTSWLYVDNIEGEWGAYNEIMKRKEAAIQTQVTEPSEVPIFRKFQIGYTVVQPYISRVFLFSRIIRESGTRFANSTTRENT